MTFPLLPGMQRQAPVTPPVTKIPVSCCGYTSLQGILAPWECPGCHTVHNPADPGISL